MNNDNVAFASWRMRIQGRCIASPKVSLIIMARNVPASHCLVVSVPHPCLPSSVSPHIIKAPRQRPIQSHRPRVSSSAIPELSRRVACGRGVSADSTHLTTAEGPR
jgi:hypothetical protein